MPTLHWIGKDKVINHHFDVPFKTLHHQYGFEQNAQTEAQTLSGNKIIHGDNLEALKALLPEYEGKIKCIYIDPPYNTGNESWVYNDNVNDPKIKKWLGTVVGKEAEDLTRHDKWLCMMYPRLKLLHKLLANDGAIFISIDDNEHANLKLICDEIFGNGNFVRAIACINNPKGRSDDKYIATAHETILVYRKSNSFQAKGFAPDEKITKRFTKIDLDGKIYREIDLRKTGDGDTRKDRPNMYYPFFYNKKLLTLNVATLDEEVPDNCIVILPKKSESEDGRWRWGSDTAKENITKIFARYMPSKKQWSIFEKDFLDDKEEIKPTSVWDFKDVNSERGTEVFIKELGFDKKDFPNPKPVGTIERVLTIATNDNDIILDSFAGSGTTAHAVLNLNEADNGNRKFILIEMEAYAENITAERVKRVIDGTGGKEKMNAAFDFYTLGQAVFLEDGVLNEAVGEAVLRQYIFYSETKKTLDKENIATDNVYFLEKYNDTSYYFFYKENEMTTLDYDFLATMSIKAEQYIIYADNCLLPKDFLTQHRIVFKKIPRDITRF